mgnify:FL=1
MPTRHNHLFNVPPPGVLGPGVCQTCGDEREMNNVSNYDAVRPQGGRTGDRWREETGVYFEVRRQLRGIA